MESQFPGTKFWFSCIGIWRWLISEIFYFQTTKKKAQQLSNDINYSIFNKRGLQSLNILVILKVFKNF